MKLTSAVAGLIVLLATGGCGTYIPSTRDWPDNDDLAESDMIATIARSVGCELSYTITRIVTEDRRAAPERRTGRTYTDFLEEWGVQVALNLTIYERTGLNPTVLLTPPSIPSSVFTMFGGINASTEASRLQKINFFYTVSELYKPAFFRDGIGREACRDPRGNKEGSPLVDSDLRLFSLLEGRLGATMLGFVGSPATAPLLGGEKNVLSQTVSFKVLTSGQLNPAWKLVRASVNTSGTLVSTGRDRTHELVFTFGPLDKSVRGRRTLTPFAQQTHLDTQLQSGIRNNLIGQ